VAAYNRQGMGPFSEPVQLMVNTEGLSLAAYDQDNVGLMPEMAPGLDLAAQEVWFVSVLSFLSVVLLVGLAGLVCFRQRTWQEKGAGSPSPIAGDVGNGADSGHYNGEGRDLHVETIHSESCK